MGTRKNRHSCDELEKVWTLNSEYQKKQYAIENHPVVSKLGITVVGDANHPCSAYTLDQYNKLRPRNKKLRRYQIRIYKFLHTYREDLPEHLVKNYA